MSLRGSLIVAGQGAQVGKLLAKTKMGKYITWAVTEGRLGWSLNQAAVDAAQSLDGCYVIKTTVSAEAMGKDEVVARYKSLSQVEQAFRNMKSVSLEMRPVHHKKDDRIRAHVFLCMLAYYLQWHLCERLRPLFDEQEERLKGKGVERKERSWTLQSVLDTLKSIRANDVSVGEVKFEQISQPSEEAQKVLGLLKVKLPRIK